MKLSCKLCDYKSEDLVPHIEGDHATEITLEAYMKAHGGIDSVISAALQQKHTPEVMQMSTAQAVSVKAKTKKICDIQMTIIGDDSDFVPAIDDGYEFQSELTKRVLVAINDRKHVLLTGHTGSGKTSMVEQIAARIGQPTLRVNLNEQTTYADFIGHWAVIGGEMVWLDGALPTAMKMGYWLVLDEIDYGSSNILCSLNPVLENKPKLVLKEHRNEVVKVHENFRVFGTGNTLGVMSSFRHLYQGANLMNEAWLDRWQVFKVDYMSEEAETRALVAKTEKLTAGIAKELVRVAGMVRKAFTEETVSCTFSTRRLLDWSHALISEVVLAEGDRAKKAEAPFKAAQYTIFNKVSLEDAATIEGIVRRVLMGRE